MALQYAGITVEHREIELRNKPQSMLRVSPKGTVPVLIVGNLILDQSLEAKVEVLKVINLFQKVGRIIYVKE